MKTVRYFGVAVDPEQFRGHGFFYFVAIIANKLRYWLERLVVMSLLRSELAGRHDLTRADRSRLLRQAKEDPEFSPYSHPIVRKVRSTPFREALAIGARAHRYAEGRKNGRAVVQEASLTPLDDQDSPFQGTLAAVLTRNGVRSARYHPQNTGLLYESDEEET